MQQTILQKCVEELTKETPDLSYIRGMLETLIALNVPTPYIAQNIVQNSTNNPPYENKIPTDDENIEAIMRKNAEDAGKIFGGAR